VGWDERYEVVSVSSKVHLSIVGELQCSSKLEAALQWLCEGVWQEERDTEGWELKSKLEQPRRDEVEGSVDSVTLILVSRLGREASVR